MGAGGRDAGMTPADVHLELSEQNLGPQTIKDSLRRLSSTRETYHPDEPNRTTGKGIRPTETYWYRALAVAPRRVTSEMD